MFLYIEYLSLYGKKNVWKSVGNFCKREPCVQRGEACSCSLWCSNPRKIKTKKRKTCNYFKFLISNGFLMFYFFLQLIFWQALQTLAHHKAWVWLKVGQSSLGARSNVAIHNHHQLLLNLAVLVMGLKSGFTLYWWWYWFHLKARMHRVHRL